MTFKDFKKARRIALDLVSFGRVRIERCYRLVSNEIEVVYKVYLDNLWADEDLLKTLEKYSNDFEEDLNDLRKFLQVKDRILRVILDVLSSPKSFDDVVKEVCSRIEDISVSRNVVRSVLSSGWFK